jgi:hypothetical protein
MYKHAMEEEVIEETVEICLPAEEIKKLMDELKDNPEEAAKKINELINSQIQTVNI